MHAPNLRYLNVSVVLVLLGCQLPLIASSPPLESDLLLRQHTSSANNTHGTADGDCTIIKNSIHNSAFSESSCCHPHVSQQVNIECDSNERVISISANWGTEITISEEIVELDKLEELTLHGDTFKVNLTSNFTAKNLKTLNLNSANKPVHILKNFLDHFPGVVNLKFQHCQINQTAKNFLALLPSNAVSINLVGNCLSGDLDGKPFPNLEYLDLSNNMLSGFKLEFLTQSRVLRILRLANNFQLMQEIPHDIGDLKELK
ncbi:MAG: hypothetical protein SGCHY_004913, partial [Lobulomycetales sp.]